MGELAGVRVERAVEEATHHGMKLLRDFERKVVPAVDELGRHELGTELAKPRQVRVRSR